MRFRADDLRRQGWVPPQTRQIPDWCGCSTEYLPVPEGDGWWALVPIWEPAQTPSPLRRWEPAVPYPVVVVPNSQAHLPLPASDPQRG